MGEGIKMKDIIDKENDKVQAYALKKIAEELETLNKTLKALLEKIL